MLLLILFAGCLATGAAQTTSFSSVTTETSPTTESPFTHPIQLTTVLPASHFTNNTVAILRTAVLSSRELNHTTIAPVLNKLYDIIRRLQPGLNFTLTVKDFTEV